ncbi:MAG: hypothetical protein NDI90_10820 [Nitrospira sp. BO4]|jgi:hypothetical protein|nr:hypothetical protein [Nitrospira sp. BO4]
MALFVPAKRSTLYARICIPQELRYYFNGRKEIWRSLKTADKDLAQVRAERWKALANGIFLTLKRYGEGMTKADIETLVQRWLCTAPSNFGQVGFWF